MIGVNQMVAIDSKWLQRQNFIFNPINSISKQFIVNVKQ